MIRRATFADIPRLFDLIAAMHRGSRYAAVATLDEKAAKAMLVQSIQRHGGTAAGSTLVMVAEDAAGTVQGFVVGMLARLYDIGVELMATDWMFHAAPGAPPRAAGRLIDAVIGWAAANPRVLVQRYGVTDALGDPARTGRLFARRGFRAAGAIFERTRGDGV
jgi:hypothetical protein